jgi:acetyl esterase
MSLRAHLETALFDGMVRSVVAAARLHPASDPTRHGVEVVKDVRYGGAEEGWRRLDVFLPSRRQPAPPCLLYLHGGSFTRQSKEEYWLACLTFARAGFVVFNADYRLAPRHRYPAAVEDACAALLWVAEQAAGFGGDPRELVVAGDSAGGNLAAATALAACYPIDEPWAARFFERDVRPSVVVSSSTMFQVSDAARWRGHGVATFSLNALRGIEKSYLPEGWRTFRDAPLADPILVLEELGEPVRPLPRFYLSVGDRDPLLPDSRRMHDALVRRGADSRFRSYRNGVHGFHILLPWLSLSRTCWEDTFRYLGEVVSGGRVLVPQRWSEAGGARRSFVRHVMRVARRFLSPLERARREDP